MTPASRETSGLPSRPPGWASQHNLVCEAFLLFSWSSIQRNPDRVEMAVSQQALQKLTILLPPPPTCWDDLNAGRFLKMDHCVCGGGATCTMTHG